MIKHQVKDLEQLIKLLSHSSSRRREWDICPVRAVGTITFNHIFSNSCFDSCPYNDRRHRFTYSKQELLNCWNHFLAKLKSNNYDDLDRLMDYKKILEENKEDKGD